MVRAYEHGGAAALSILTESDHFGGSIADVRAARAVTDLPILRKDFTVDRYQLYEAAVMQADAVLLIVAVLEREELERLHTEAGELDLDCLVEVHDAEELEAALEIDADVIGINNRNLARLHASTSPAPSSCSRTSRRARRSCRRAASVRASRSRSWSRWGSTRCSSERP